LAAIALGTAILFTVALIILAKKFPRVQKLAESLKHKLFFNSLMRFMLQSYLKMCEIAFVSFSITAPISKVSA
jgi:hypothetical protein